MLKISFFSCRLYLVAVALLLTGCADSPAKPDTRAHENKKHMAGLTADMTAAQVTNVMGLPDKIVMHRGKSNEAVLIYLYITDYRETYTSRGWNQNNYTPFLFVNDRLSGWGWNQLDIAARRYEFDIRTTPFLAPNP